MAWAQGTATDYIDFLRKLVDFATGAASFPLSSTDFTAGTTIDSGDEWVKQTNGGLQPALPGSGMATDGEVYLIGPGSDVDDQIVIGFRTYRNDGNNLYGIETRGYTSFDDTLSFETLPSVSPPAYAAFDDSTFDFWFWANNRRLIAIGKVGTTNVMIHAGFIQQFGSRGQYPYPLLIAGCQSSATQNYQGNNFGQSSLPDPAADCCYIRWVDGAWRNVRNYSGSSASRGDAMQFARGDGYCVWPLGDPTTPAAGNPSASGEGNEEALFEQYSVGNSLIISSSEIGLYPLIPAVVMSNEQHGGRIDGMFVVAGLGLTSGDTIEVDSDTYDVFSNTYRTDVVDFYAIKRE